jgi:hypothetical protein
MKRKYLLPAFLVLQIVYLKLIAFYPEVVEQYYSNGLYVGISYFMRIALGWIPFSVGDLLYGIALLFLFIQLGKTKNSWKQNWKTNLLQITNYLSVVYFVFHFLWGLNYYRVPLFEKMQIEREYSDADLENFTQRLIAKTNAIHFEITHNVNQKVTNPESIEAIFISSSNGYENLQKEYPFTYSHPSKKQSLFSLPLTYMGFAGYLNPFTNEAQVNYKLPRFSLPNVVCHEMAHQIGYASESECNFIGFLAGIKNKDLYFQYSAYSNALRYCLLNIAMKDEAKFISLKSKINPGIVENYKENDAFWKQYDTFIDKGFHAFYDQFLKMNQQKDGMESYSKFVNLLVNYNNTKPL